MQDWSSVLTSTLSACRASISVILVLLYGFLIRRWKWISQETENVRERESNTRQQKRRAIYIGRSVC